STLDDPLFERQRRQRDIQGHASAGFHKHHTMRESELAGVSDSRTKVLDQRIDVAGLPAQARQQGEIDIPGLPRLTPSLDGKSANDTATPLPLATEGLNLYGCREKRVHRRIAR